MKMSGAMSCTAWEYLARFQLEGGFRQFKYLCTKYVVGWQRQNWSAIEEIASRSQPLKACVSVLGQVCMGTLHAFIMCMKLFEDGPSYSCGPS